MRALTRALWPWTAAAPLIINGRQCVCHKCKLGLDNNMSDAEAAGGQGTRSAGTVRIHTALGGGEAKSQC